VVICPGLTVGRWQLTWPPRAERRLGVLTVTSDANEIVTGMQTIGRTLICAMNANEGT